jgi:hypothetical protein
MPRSLSALLVALVVAGCGSGTAPSPTQASISVSLSPNPVTATDCSPSPCQASDGRLFRWQVGGTLTVQETAGIGGTITAITLTAFNPQFVYTADYIVRVAGTNRLAGHGRLAIPITGDYGLVDNQNASRSVLLPYVVAFTDDHGNQLTAVATWTVN